MISEEINFINKIVRLAQCGYSIYEEPYFEVLDEQTENDSLEIERLNEEENQF